MGTKTCLAIEVLIEQFCNEIDEFCSVLKESDEIEGKHKHEFNS